MFVFVFFLFFLFWISTLEINTILIKKSLAAAVGVCVWANEEINMTLHNAWHMKQAMSLFLILACWQAWLGIQWEAGLPCFTWTIIVPHFAAFSMLECRACVSLLPDRSITLLFRNIPLNEKSWLRGLLITPNTSAPLKYLQPQMPTCWRHWSWLAGGFCS